MNTNNKNASNYNKQKKCSCDDKYGPQPFNSPKSSSKTKSINK